MLKKGVASPTGTPIGLTDATRAADQRGSLGLPAGAAADGAGIVLVGRFEGREARREQLGRRKAGGEREAGRKRFLKSRNAVRRQQDQRFATALAVPLKPQAEHIVGAGAGMKNDV
jgi:hypothetical protein